MTVTNYLKLILDLTNQAKDLAQFLEQTPVASPNTTGRDNTSFQAKFDALDALMTRITAAQAQAVLDVATLKATFVNVV